MFNTFPSIIPCFRGKNKNDKIWHKGSLEIYDGNIYIISSSSAKITNETSDTNEKYNVFSSKAFKVDESSIGIQSLYHDSKNTIVYSGDIIEFPKPNSSCLKSDFILGLVSFNGKEFTVSYYTKVEGSVAYLSENKTKLSELPNHLTTVIGNYYDTPELFNAYDIKYLVEADSENKKLSFGMHEKEEEAKETLIKMMSEVKSQTTLVLFKCRVKSHSEEIIKKDPVFSITKY